MNTDHRRGESLSCFAWFVGKDVARVLGYKDTVNAVKSHEDKGVLKMDVPGGKKSVLVINESGDYLVCGIQTVKEVFGAFDGFFANGEVFCDFVGGSLFRPQVLILGTCGELAGCITAIISQPTRRLLLRLIRLADQNRPLFVADIPPPNLVLAHPDDGGETIQKHRF